MFLKYEPGFWVSAYRARFDEGDLPPLEMRIFTERRRADAPIPGDIPCYRRTPIRFFVKGGLARAAMLLGW
jgi:hypothetical protein